MELLLLLLLLLHVTQTCNGGFYPPEVISNLCI
jgi:hypothetical protein